MSNQNSIEEFEELLKAPGVSGYEDGIRDLIEKKISRYGETRIDNIGNLYMELPGEGPHVAIVAHMDEIGMVVSNIEDNGYLRVVKVGGVKDSLLMGRQLIIHTKKGPVNGVIGHKAPHLITDDDKEDEIVSWTNTYVDVGAISYSEVKELGIDVPDPITFVPGLRWLREGFITGRPFDNRIGCYGLMEALKILSDEDTDLRLSFVWSVQEETGLRGARVVANTLSPDYMIALDTYTTSDSPGLKTFYKPIKLGEGPVLRMIDVRMMSSPRFIQHFKHSADAENIPYQYGVTGSTTDGAALQESGSLTVSLGVPVRYSHSTVEVAHWRDISNLPRLLAAGVRRLPL